MSLDLKRPLLILSIAIVAAGMAIHLNSSGLPTLRAAAPKSPQAPQEDDRPELLRAFAAIEPIDSHVHAFKNDPEITDLMDRLRLHVLDICVADAHSIYGSLDAETARAKAFIQASRGHARLCVTFDPYLFNQKDFAQKTVEKISHEFAEGAIAVKIWKNIGMEIKTPDGRYVMPDDAAFQPIYREIAAENKTLVAHVAETS